MTLLNSALTAQFSDELILQISMCKDTAIILSALERPDCPKELLIDFSFSPSKVLRIAVAKHKNTPSTTLKKMSTDDDPDVAAISKGALQ